MALAMTDKLGALKQVGIHRIIDRVSVSRSVIGQSCNRNTICTGLQSTRCLVSGITSLDSMDSSFNLFGVARNVTQKVS